MKWHVLFALAQLAVLESVAFDKSDTFDEALYVHIGAAAWRNHSIAMNPVPAWGFGAALAAAGVIGDVENRNYLYDSKSAALFRPRLLSARQATILLVVAAGLALASAARVFSPAAALLAHALWVLSPNIVANGSLATLDAWAAAWLAIALWAALAKRSLVWCAAACALATASKLPAIGAAPFLFLLNDRRDARAALTFFAGFLLALWAAYGFQFGVMYWQNHGDEFVFGPVPAPSFFATCCRSRHADSSTVMAPSFSAKYASAVFGGSMRRRWR